ncbi:MAG: extracellular solute-binding protein, partial [Dehalococcoidia bacterium]|nr:extracellular solute-binding protein [Dehalococcoidia bacterium]
MTTEKNGLDRREFLRRAGIAAAGLSLIACAPAAAPASTAPTPAAKAAGPTPAPSDADSTAKLYEAAKKEGEVAPYGTGTGEDWQKIPVAFEKRFPGIKVKAYTGNSETVRDKIFTEARAGKPLADFVKSGFDDVYAFEKEGLLDAYLSPEIKNYDKQYYDQTGHWIINAYYIDVIEYNTQAISKEQAPKSYQDLLKPEFKGKLGLEASAIPWFTGMLRVLGKEKGIDYMKKLAEQKPRLITGHSTLHKQVISGEIPVAVYVFSTMPLLDQAKGAPIQWVDPLEATPARTDFMAVIKNAPHPN